MAVYDASVVVALFIDHPWSGATRQILMQDQDARAPAFILVESANALWTNVRRQTISSDRAVLALRLMPWTIRLEPDASLIESALQIALRVDHPVYDCLYLALAERETLPLITADRKLASISQKRQVQTTLLAPRE